MFRTSRSARLIAQQNQLRAAIVSISTMTIGTGTGIGTGTITITSQERCG